MSFVTGLLLIDAPASALNNLGSVPGSRTDNTVGVKSIRTKEGVYPYVSAQSFRYWLRTTLEQAGEGWVSAPIYREEKVAYTDANPIQWWDDDLFGYMRAPSKKTAAVELREADAEQDSLTPVADTVTRVSPFRVSTLVSISPVNIVDDFGTMSRHEGNPVPHEHQFYRTTLKGLFSLDLHACGTFSYRNKTGFRNLDSERLHLAKELELEHLEQEKSYRLSTGERVRRVATFFDGLARLEGGAKQALHYTDVAPALVIMAVTKGGNHIFNHVVGATPRGLPTIKIDALSETISVFRDELLSDVFIGWTRGYLDDERAKLDEALSSGGSLHQTPIRIEHPRKVFELFCHEVQKPENEIWIA